MSETPKQAWVPAVVLNAADQLAAEFTAEGNPEVGLDILERLKSDTRMETFMVDGKEATTKLKVAEEIDNPARKHADEILLKTGALQQAILNSANFSSIATDAKGVIQIFNVGAERMLGYSAAEVVDRITPADISDPREVITRAQELST